MSRKNIENFLKRGVNIILHLKMNTNGKATSYQTNKKQEQLANENGVAIVVVNKELFLKTENNNSICEILYNSAEFASECAKFCGNAFQMAAKAAKPVGYKCHAGLNCLAVPLQNKRFVAIVGRKFLTGADYRTAAERARAGDWKHFSLPEFFENVLLGGTNENLENLVRQVEELYKEQEKEQKKITEIKMPELKFKKAAAGSRQAGDEIQNSNFKVQNSKLREWRSLFGSLLELDYREACIAILQFVSDYYAIKDSAWLERKEDRLTPIAALGSLKDRDIQISIPAYDERLLDVIKAETSLEMRERQPGNEEIKPRTASLFPIAVGDEIRSALIVGTQIEDKNLSRRISRFCRKISSELEILRLREQLERRSFVERAVSKFNESLRTIDAEDFWLRLTHTSAELMNAERSSLLVYDEKTGTFVVKAAIGGRANFIGKTKEKLGERVAKDVMSAGEAMVVSDVGKTNLSVAPQERLYKSDSFISYPISIGRRKIGVLNLTDKAGGESYNETDLELLNAIAPSLAVMIDRTDLKNKAGEFEQLSVTDALTGLLNRRYLEERLAEEVKRSNRHNFPLSFMMIDVDQFKSYNDKFGHPEGDKALQIVGDCLRETLRDEDVAARYGGEEFSILLPQTNASKASVIAERIRERIAQTTFPNRKVTVSIGVASFSPTLNSAEELIRAADESLYEAKRNGRNNVQVHENIK